MKNTIKSMLRNFRQWVPGGEGPCFDPEMQAAIDEQIAWVKEQYPDAFKEELRYVDRNREFIASDNLVNWMRDKPRDSDFEPGD